MGDGKISRRRFLWMSSLSAAGALLGACGSGKEAPPAVPGFRFDYDPMRTYPYRGWESLYEKQWTWDKVVRSTHSANCTGSCSWQVYVKDGVMLREEQASDYPRISADLPDYNPRGCQKGACFVEYVYGAQRLRFPLLRVGKRGEGKWRRATWDEALELVAGKLLDNVYRYGPDTNSFFSVIPAMSPVSFCGGSRVAHYLGGVFLSFYDWYCDLPPGEPLTWGVQTEACECADWFNAKMIVMWGSNITQTRIPDAHFAFEARYNGAKIVGISPDFNSSCTHADLYLGIAPGTDAELALGVARILVEEKLYDAPYVREQTDMPLLVVEKTRRYLRESDMEENGGDEVFYFFDEKEGKVTKAPGSMGSPTRSIDLSGAVPALTGRYFVPGRKGEKIAVAPVFERMRKLLARYTLKEVARRTGLSPRDIAAFARDLGTRRPAMIIHGAGTNHWFHNDLINRAMMLLVALTGDVGKNGGGFNHYVGQERIWPEEGFKKLAFPEGGKKQRFQNTTLWTYVHSSNKDEHRYNGKPIEEYIEESVAKGWMPLYPRNRKQKPRSLIVWRANYLNQAKGNEKIIPSLWNDLDLIVNVNFRMDTTALYSDVVLPASSYYEKTDLNTTDCHSFVHPFNKVLDPLFESRTDWDIFSALAKKIEEVALRRKLPPYKDDELGWTRDFTSFHRQWSGDGKIATDEAAANFILANAEETKGMTFAGLQAHPLRFVNTDPHVWNSDVEPGIAYTPFKHQVEKKKPWRTLVGRQQFYIDHPWFLDLGEELPVSKEPVTDPYPLYWNTPHGRWSIHSTWRDNRYMLRLQRGMPIAYLNPLDAAARGIADNDWIRIYNHIGFCVVRAKILPGEQRGRVTMYHGWEKFLGFRQGGWQSLTYIKIKPTQLIGKYGHVNFKLNYWGPTGNNRDVKVEVEKANI